MKKPKFYKFTSIRGKLTLSYVFVTVLATIVLEAILVLVAVWSVYAHVFVPKTVARTAELIALSVRSEYMSGQPDPAQLNLILNHLTQPIDRSSEYPPHMYFDMPVPTSLHEVEQRGEVRFDDMPALWQVTSIVLLDTNARVLTSTLKDGYQQGALLSEIEVPEATSLLPQVLEAAQRGEAGAISTTSAGQMSQPLAVAPIMNKDGTFYGLAYVRFAPPPPLAMLSFIPLLLQRSFLPILLMSVLVGSVVGLIAGMNMTNRLKRLSDASAALANGDLTQQINDPSGDEIGQLGRQFNSMAEQLGENFRSLYRLAEQNAQLAEQATQLATVEERNRLARDLHDTVSQELFSLTMLAAAAQRLIHSDPQLAAAQLEEIQETTKRTLQETRSLIFALRPAMLDNRGLAPALRDLIQGSRERQGLDVELFITGERLLPLEQEQALFRIVQEALANVVRHSGVRQASVSLTYTDKDTSLEVSDQGRGFDVHAVRNPRCIGLDSMAERSKALGGSFVIESVPGQGTSVRVQIPVAKE
jgi:NarL family two-component system sensor histidine kinase LiaS